MESYKHVVAREAGRPINPHEAEECWIPTFAGMTLGDWQAQ